MSKHENEVKLGIKGEFSPLLSRYSSALHVNIGMLIKARSNQKLLVRKLPGTSPECSACAGSSSPGSRLGTTQQRRSVAP